MTVSFFLSFFLFSFLFSFFFFLCLFFVFFSLFLSYFFLFWFHTHRDKHGQQIAKVHQFLVSAVHEEGQQVVGHHERPLQERQQRLEQGGKTQARQRGLAALLGDGLFDFDLFS